MKGPSDPRRIGLASLGVAVAYCLALAVDESPTVRVAIGIIVAITLVVVTTVAPLPAWQEASNRKLVARNVMVIEAVVVVIVGTTIRLVV